jgi:phage terminase large subunit-like protein
MGQTLFDLLNGQNLVLYADDELRQQALSTVSIETPRGWRIAKEKASKKIDAIVALSMACVTAMAHRGDLSSRATRGALIVHYTLANKKSFRSTGPFMSANRSKNRAPLSFKLSVALFAF